MGRGSESEAEEFEMKHISVGAESEGNPSKSRSLVFRISKRTKSSKQRESSDSCNTMNENAEQTSENDSEMLQEPIGRNDISNGTAAVTNLLSSVENGHSKNLSPLKVEIPELSIPENKDSGLRRTSRKIIVRVEKDFLPSIASFSMGRRGRERKEADEERSQRKVSPKLVRGRGRPKSTGRDFKIPKLQKKAYQFKDQQKEVKKVPPFIKKGVGPAVWTLVPQEIMNSEYFKSQVLKVHYPSKRGRKPKSYSGIPCAIRKPLPTFLTPLTMSDKENTDVQNQMPLSTVEKPPFQQDQTLSSSKPTVIYFKIPKQYVGRDPSNLDARENPYPDKSIEEGGLAMSKRQWDLMYLRNKYGNFLNENMLEFLYSVSYGDLLRTESLVADIRSGKKEVIVEGDSPPRIICCPDNAHQNVKLEPEEDIDESKISTPDYADSEIPDTLCRQVIVDSMRILFDEMSVLEYN